MLGCCSDKKYGKGCNDGTCRHLPKGRTCSVCQFYGYCGQMYGAKAGDTSCGFFPRRFQPLSLEIDED